MQISAPIAKSCRRGNIRTKSTHSILAIWICSTYCSGQEFLLTCSSTSLASLRLKKRSPAVTTTVQFTVYAIIRAHTEKVTMSARQRGVILRGIGVDIRGFPTCDAASKGISGVSQQLRRYLSFFRCLKNLLALEPLSSELQG